MWKIGIVLLLTSCGARSSSPAQTDGRGEPGAVCHCARNTDDSCHPVACRADLVCGYGCGIPGCNSTCMIKSEFEDSPKIP